MKLLLLTVIISMLAGCNQYPQAKCHEGQLYYNTKFFNNEAIYVKAGVECKELK